MSNLAISLSEQGRYPEAEKLILNVLDIRKRILGLEHEDTLASRRSLSANLIRAGRYADAEASLRDLVEIHRRLLGPEHPSTVVVK